MTWESCAIDLPEQNGQLVYRRTAMHLWNQEYRQGIYLCGGVGSGKDHPLMMNTGGDTRMNVFWIACGQRTFVGLEDSFGDYLLDLHGDEMYLVIRTKGREYVAPVQSEEPDVHIVDFGGAARKMEVKVDGIMATPLTSLTPDCRKQYIGAVTDTSGTLRFTPASECPECKIEKVWEW